jgi:hypothetical protein
MKEERKILNKKVTLFVQSFDEDLTAKLGIDFEYSFEKERVQFPLDVDDIHDIYFVDFINKVFGYKVKNVYMMSLLHELGHHFTGFDFDDEEEEHYLKRIKKISKQLSKNPEDRMSYFEYYSLPQEIAATAWAVNYYRNNEKEIRREWKKIKKALVDYTAVFRHRG